MHEGRIVHIAEDEKFINTAFRTFEQAFPGKNFFIIIRPAANPPLKYLDRTLPLHFEVNRNGIIERLHAICNTADIVVLHGLNSMKGKLVLKSANREKFLGIPLGAELYNPAIAGSDYLGTETSKLYRDLSKPAAIDFVKYVYRKIRYRQISDFSDRSYMPEVFKSVRTYGTFSEITLKQWEKDEIIPPGARQLFFTYYPIELVIRNPEMKCTGNHILVGNSASATNNHLEAFSLLKNLDIAGKKIITPLSYGNTRYATAIKKRGRKIFGSQFIPLNDFLSLADYNSLICNCGTVIMNHYRSQAVGNIVASLYFGCRVYLNRTDAYHFFRSIGCHINLIDDDLKDDNPLHFTPLSLQQVNENREILNRELGLEKLIRSLKYSFGKHFGFN